MQILVTGGAGFIGSHLCERLIKDGHTVTVVDNFSTGRSSNLVNLIGADNFTLVEGSILDSEILKPLMDAAEYVFHLAAAVGVFNIVNNPLVSLLTNIRGTENVLEIAHETKIPVLIGFLEARLRCDGLIVKPKLLMNHLHMLTLLKSS